MSDRRHIMAVVAALITFVTLVFYVFPRHRHMDRLHKEVLDLQVSQAAVAKLIPEASEQSGNMAPNPTPNVPGWLTTRALGGLDKHLITNDPYLKGQGASLELRALKPLEVSNLLGQMTQVNLIIKSLTLTDFNARGVWDVKLQVEVPGTTAATPTPSPTPAADKP